jgi:hypothetical protein
MRFAAAVIASTLLSLILSTQATPGNQIYRYKDDSGTLNFTTELHSIPEKYRGEAVSLVPEASIPIEKPKSPASAPRVVTASGEYRMGDHDTRIDATRMAVEAAKRQALEQVASYLESVTEVKDLDVTRDEIRSYTAGIVTVLDQRTTTRLEDGAVVVQVDLTAEVDPEQVILAINTLREDERAAQELAALRMETDQLRQRLDAANQALATANTSEQVHALTRQRQQLLDQMQADALVAQALAGYAYVTPASVKQINELLHRAKELHPSNPHERSLSGRTDVPSQPGPPAQTNTLGGPFMAPSHESPLAAPLPESPLATPLPPSPLATPLPQSPLAAPLPPSPLAAPLPQSPLAKPLGPSPLAAPLAPSPLAAPLR